MFTEVPLNSFWCKMAHSYPKISKLAIRMLLPFPSPYLCESVFSTLFHIKTKHRNRLSVEDDMLCAISKTEPDIKKTGCTEASATISLVNTLFCLDSKFKTFTNNFNYLINHLGYGTKFTISRGYESKRKLGTTALNQC